MATQGGQQAYGFPARNYVLYSFIVATGGAIAYSLLKSSHLQESARPLQADSSDPNAFDKASKSIRVIDRQKLAEQQRQGDSNAGFFQSDWSTIGDRIRGAILPEWAQYLPAFVTKLQNELSGEPGTLADEMWQDAHDPQVHPEIERDAMVRVSNELCDEEKAFLRKRKHHTKKALARYLNIPEEEIHPDDVPTLAMCGSGGGLRACVAGSSYCLSAEECGLFDCVTYTAGVSGSCWMQTLYNSSLTHQKFGNVLKHLKNRLGTHIAFPPPFLNMVTSAPTNKYLLAGPYEKYKGFKNADFGLVDVYGLLLGARLLVPKGEVDIDSDNLKLSNQRKYVDEGAHPLPLYTAVRHEIPDEKTLEKERVPDDVIEESKKEAWFQWFEFSPYELWCEEFGSGIPTWSIGRTFHAGKSTGKDNIPIPEIRIPLLMGVWASAFCATLSHYYQEIQPVVQGLSGISGLDHMIKQRDESLIKVHPVQPATIPNYAMGMKEQLPEQCPESVPRSKELELMDAGMSNNLPVYPLLRPGRDVDILIAFDSSADIKQCNWLRVADGYARQRGIRSWPIGTGWPDPADSGPKDTGEEIAKADKMTTAQATENVERASQDQQSQRDANEAAAKASNEPAESKDKRQTDLDYCNIWVGTTEERTATGEPPPSKMVEAEWELMRPDAGISVIYYPFVANPKVEEIDPETSDFMSTWNFIYTPEHVDKVRELASANFKEGEEKTKMAVRAVYERKKKSRLQREGKSKS
ncbi:MAG: hypothetical protein M1831_004428 [Alyxoria varia]|nr:MAG: hypothetical protein M1831_004428 [Alyxoria varia]